MIEITKNPNRVYEKIASRNQLGDPEIIYTVSQIMNEVRINKDSALKKYTKEFDNIDIDDFLVSEEEFKKAYEEIDENFLLIIRKAIKNIREYHEKQKQESWIWEKSDGIKLGQKISPIERVGIYVPGGTAPLVSSVLMNAIPAKIAGCEEIIMCTPPGIDSGRLVAAKEAGVDKVYKLGGAQAIFAMAFGTETINKVDKITGPGNIYVANAKKLAYGYCDIDMIAGPSEVMVIADMLANPKYIAADLLSQAEHDTKAGVIFATDSETLANKVSIELEIQLNNLNRKDIASKSIDDYGIICVCETLDECFKMANTIAPEHLELMIKNSLDYVDKVKHAGAIFLGEYSPEPLGDYFAGPNHTLPTGGSARFYSPLGVYDFMKRTSIIKYDKASLKKVYKDIEFFAKKEELDAHANSIKIRFEDINE